MKHKTTTFRLLALLAGMFLSGGFVLQAQDPSVQEVILDVSPRQFDNSTYSVLGDPFIARSAGGGLLVGGNKRMDLFVLDFDRNLKPSGREYALQGSRLVEMQVLPSGDVFLLSGTITEPDWIQGYPNNLWATLLGPDLRLRWRTQVSVSQGIGPGMFWYDGLSKAVSSFNGREFGIYFEVKKNWAPAGSREPDVHNGDMFVVLDLQGRVLPNRTHFWTASHSNTLQASSVPDGSFWTATVVDGPSHVQLYNRSGNTPLTVWPDPQDRIAYEQVESTNAAGLLNALVPVKDGFLFFLGTLPHPNIGVFTKTWPMVLNVDRQGREIRRNFLEQGNGIDANKMLVVPWKGNFLLLYGPGNEYENDWKPGPLTWAMVDAGGATILPPLRTSLELASYSDALVWNDSTLLMTGNIPPTTSKLVLKFLQFSGLPVAGAAAATERPGDPAGPASPAGSGTGTAPASGPAGGGSPVWLGVSMTEIPAAFRSSMRLAGVSGVVLAGVASSGPAARSGLLPGDVLATLNGQKTTTPAELVQVISRLKADQDYPATVVRKGAWMNLKVRLQVKGAAAESETFPGFTIAAADPEGPAGVVVAALLAGKGLARQAGLAPGDLIYLVNGLQVSNPAEFYQALGSSGSLTLGFIRDGQAWTAEIPR